MQPSFSLSLARAPPRGRAPSGGGGGGTRLHWACAAHGDRRGGLQAAPPPRGLSLIPERGREREASRRDNCHDSCKLGQNGR